MTTSTVRAEVSTCQTAAAWSSRSPLRVTVLARVLRALAQLRRQQLRVGSQPPRRELAWQPGRALRLRVRDEPLLCR